MAMKRISTKLRLHMSLLLGVLTLTLEVSSQEILLEPVLVGHAGISYGSHNASIDGNHNNRVTCAHSRVCYAIYDVGRITNPAIMQYFTCRLPGFTNGAVRQFNLSVSNSSTGPFVQVLIGTVLEQDQDDAFGIATSWYIPLADQVSGRYFKFNVISNHGNGAYIWFCETRFYTGYPLSTPRATTPWTPTTQAAYIVLTGDDQGHANIAYGKNATMSSCWRTGYCAQNALDGFVPRLRNAVQFCSHTRTEDMPFWQVDLGENYAVANVTIVGRVHQTNQADNLKIFVSDSADFADGNGTSYPCGGPDAIWHTNGRGGQVYTRHHTESTIVVPCHLYGRYVTIQAQENNSALVICEVMVSQVPQQPSCAGCGWRLQACNASAVQAWSVDYLHFVGSTGNGTAVASGTRQQPTMREYRGPEYPFQSYVGTSAAGHGDGWDGLVNPRTGNWYIGKIWDSPQNVTDVYYMTGSCDGGSTPAGFNTCVELQRWDGSIWLTENWHDELTSCTWYDLQPEGRALTCTCAVSLLGDGNCDLVCNTSACGFDRGDCPYTAAPTLTPTQIPTQSPTQSPTDVPTTHPSDAPTDGPTQPPTDAPTLLPTYMPTMLPTKQPTLAPTKITTGSTTKSGSSSTGAGNDVGKNLGSSTDSKSGTAPIATGAVLLALIIVLAVWAYRYTRQPASDNGQRADAIAFSNPAYVGDNQNDYADGTGGYVDFPAASMGANAGVAEYEYMDPGTINNTGETGYLDVDPVQGDF
eukprot:m.350028 g.350028  ORF g.350028 m.350028 type:complete len:752 (-) comp20691_c1_seq6:218-2473(-)